MVMNSPARSLPLQLSAEDSPRFWKFDIDRSQTGHILQRKKVFFPSRSLENREKFNEKKRKEKGKTIIILWPRRKIISSLDKSFVELENFQARHEVFFRQFGRSVNCLCSAYSFILFFSCIQSIFTSFCYNETCNFIWLELKFSSTLKFKITLKNILAN